MKKILTLFYSAFFLTFSICNGQESTATNGINAINQNVLKAQLGFLASDWTEGRMTGEKGAYLASDYIASILQLYGVKPGGDYTVTRNKSDDSDENIKSYFQNFTLLKTRSGDKQLLQVQSTNGKTIKTTDYVYNVDFSFRPLAKSIEINAPVIFAGYGIVNNKLKYNDFSKVDVKGKLILKITGMPLFMRGVLNQTEYSSMIRDTESTLKSMGAAGIIEFNPASAVVGYTTQPNFNNMAPSENKPRTGRPYERYSIPGRVAAGDFIKINVSAKVANEILAESGINVEEYIKKTDANESVSLPPLQGINMILKTTVISSLVSARNVIGVIEGTESDQVIVLGAHYDHMGTGNGYIWNGADDNASGTVGVMTLAKAIMETGVKPEKTIIIALWTGEEEGLLGSRYWIQNPTCPIDDVKLNVNFDMISRYISDDEPNSVTMTYNDTNPGFKEMTETNLLKHSINLDVDFQPSSDPPGGTDHRSFVAAGIPVMRFKPGHREEYHTPYDEISTVDWDIMEKIVKISFANVWELANSDW